MIRVDLAHSFSVPVSKAFAFITEPANWHTFFPNFVRLYDPTHAKWRTSGDTVTVAIRILGRPVDVHMTLEEFETDRRVAYASRQAGLPDARHERLFVATPRGFEFRLQVALNARSGWLGLYDRFLVKPAVAGALRKTVENLDRIFDQRPWRE